MFLERIRAGDAAAWAEFIRMYEGRLLAYLEPRVSDRTTAEDLVQETFTGFLISLPNYDARQPLENWLFAIAAHKLVDHLRRKNRRPGPPEDLGGDLQSVPLKDARGPSTLLASRERQGREELAIVEVARRELETLRKRGEWLRVACLELLFAAGLANKEVATILNLSEQQVANWKFDFLSKLKKRLGGRISATALPES